MNKNENVILKSVATGVVIGALVTWVVCYVWNQTVQHQPLASSNLSGQEIATHGGSTNTEESRLGELVEKQARQIANLVAEIANLVAENESLRRRAVETQSVTTGEEIRAETDADGHVIARGPVKNGIKTGMWELWDADDHKIAEGEFLDGKRSGLWNTWSNDGTLMGSGRYVDGLREGNWRFVETNGSEQNFYYRAGVVDKASR